MDSRLTWNLALAVATASIGSGFQHGYNLHVINAPEDVLKSWLCERHKANYGHDLTDTQTNTLWSILVNIFILGAFFGATLTETVLRVLGPRKGLLYDNILVVIGCLLQFVSMYVKYYEVLIFGRLLVGVSVGVSSGVCPVFVCDLAPVRFRGGIGSTYVFFVELVQILVFVLGMDRALGGENTWSFLTLVPVVPAIVQALLLHFLIPDSPSYLLVTKKDRTRAEAALRWLKGKEEGMPEEVSEESEVAPLKDFFSNPRLWKPLLIVVVLMATRQLSGIVTVKHYSDQLFLGEAGLLPDDMPYANVGYMIVSALVAALSAFLLIEMFGRKPLLVASMICLAVCQVALLITLMLIDKVVWIAYASIASIYSAVFSIAIGQDGIPWFFSSELFPYSALPIAQTFTACTSWGVAFLASLAFDSFIGLVGSYGLVIFVAVNVSTALFVVFFVPETRNKAVAEVGRFFEKK